MSPAFPHPCSHCGLCCIVVTCPLGQELMQVPAPGPCPALEWDGGESRCGLIAHPERHLPPPLLARLDLTRLPAVIGSGAGCCISARVLTDRGEQDFAALPAATKTRFVHALHGQ